MTPLLWDRPMRAWLPDTRITGPERATERDIEGLNRVFAEAFTDRYRRDGLIGVRVPQLNPLVWRYALLDAGEGAMIWRDEHDDIAAFNVAHQAGVEGWMDRLADAGALAIRTHCQRTHPSFDAGLMSDVERRDVVVLVAPDHRSFTGIEQRVPPDERIELRDANADQPVAAVAVGEGFREDAVQPLDVALGGALRPGYPGVRQPRSHRAGLT